MWFSSSIEAKLWDAGRSARRAIYETQLAHTLDPTRPDVGLVLGSYRYMLSGLPGTVRLLASIIGFVGGRAEGLRLLEAAAASPSDLQEEAQFRLILIYTRARRHMEAVAVIRDMERTTPAIVCWYQRKRVRSSATGRPPKPKRCWTMASLDSSRRRGR